MSPAPPSAALADLAHALGVASEYWDWLGRHVTVSAATIRAVLAAMDVTVETDEQARAALAALEAAAWRRTLPATVVMREGWTPWVHVHVPHGAGLSVSIELEDGSTRAASPVDRWVPPREIDGVLVGEATVELPGDLPLGWHRLVAHVESGGDAAGQSSAPDATATLVVTPQRLELPEALRGKRAVGLTTQLYQVRSAGSWGVGDLHDLATLGRWAAERMAADFVLVNPLHAAEPGTPMEPSPYLPTSRRFVNPLYLRIEDIPETRRLDADKAARVARLAARARALNTADTIDRDAAWRAKREALEIVNTVALEGRRAADYVRFCEREGDGLATFATWCAIVDEHGSDPAGWAAELRDPAGPAVAAFRASHAECVDLHRWLQWLLDRQLGRTQHALIESGMALGVIHDLAVGVHPHGADAWGLADALARGVSVGAPPDQFNQLGQNWSQPPWRPDRLAELGYRPFRDMVRTVLRDSGGIRVDHVMGLFRLWWIPEGRSPAEGTYVRYDHEALVGILALEAHRVGALVVGEDLGVVEPATRAHLHERGILGTSIMWFEWSNGEPMPPEGYRELCLSSVTTHDLPPTAGYLALAHVDLRERLGLLTRPVAEERAHEEHTIATVRRALIARGLLDPGAGPEAMLVAMHRWLAQTPSRLLGISLADLVGDRRAINQPGTSREYPNWCLPLAGADGRPISLEEIMTADLAGHVADVLAPRVVG